MTMRTYRDVTFCPFYKGCCFADECPRPLTSEVKAAAVAWWGSEDAPISIFLDEPDCFMPQGKERRARRSQHGNDG